MLKLAEPFRNQEILIIPFFKSLDLGFYSFWMIFCPLDSDPWIRIQAAKILRIQRIRILSTVLFS